MGKQLSIDEAITEAVASQDGREGAGGRDPDASSQKTRNSSGARSPASQLLDLRIRFNAVTRCVHDLALRVGDEAMAAELAALLRSVKRG